jgi:DNA-binding PadR family transcriptional regulator
MEEKKSYYAIIPANVRYDKNINANAKLLYGEITALCNEKGFCWASNKYFADLYGVSETSVSLWIKKLVDNGYIESEIENNFDRKLFIASEEKLKGVLRKVKGGIKKTERGVLRKVKDNNTYNTKDNNTYNTSDKSQEFETSFSPEVIKAMEAIDPKNKTYYGNKTQRKCADFLVKEYGLQKVIEMIDFIASSRGKIKYLPSITSPYDLQEKWQKVIDVFNRKLADNNEKLNNVIW